MTKIHLTFTVYGDDWNPSELTELINLTPTDYGIKNDLLKKYLPNQVLRKETSWEYNFETVQSLFLEDITCEFVRVFKPCVEKLTHFIELNNLCSKLFIIPEIMDNEVPSIFFDQEILKLLVQLKAEIDIDLYIVDSM